ncbi:FixH family protein [Oikeobacillus pervagus]|nr:FixH family protein [Oikeobacillus pervagus]
MKKRIFALLMLVIVLAGCKAGGVDFSIETAPSHKYGQSFPIVIKAVEGSEAVTGLEITANLEMAKMDHGEIEVHFTNNGDGTYEGEVELPMAGEWIAEVQAEKDGETYEGTLEFDVEEE